MRKEALLAPPLSGVEPRAQCTAAISLSSRSAGTAPSRRRPSARNTVGVPSTFIAWPSARFLSIAAVSQVPAAVGA